MIASIVPAHNEAFSIAACLESLFRASRCVRLDGEPVRVIVVLDACTDATASICRDHGADVVEVDARNVGIARAAGAEFALQHGARWLAFTDADSRVAPDWFAAQLALGCDAVCGTVAVDDWGEYGQRMQRHYGQSYTDADGHHHIHGANLGVSAEAYRRVGGFRALCSSEDVDLVHSLQREGASIAWSAAPRVITSSRSDFRAPDGFGATLLRVDRESALSGAGR